MPFREDPSNTSVAYRRNRIRHQLLPLLARQYNPRIVETLVAHAKAGTIVIDTPNTYLYYVLGGGQAIRYGIGVGRDGFRWGGVHRISAKKEWPGWTPLQGGGSIGGPAGLGPPICPGLISRGT